MPLHDPALVSHADVETALVQSGHAAHIMRQLQQLPWRRIDAEFRGSRTPFFAHNHLQVGLYLLPSFWIPAENGPMTMHTLLLTPPDTLLEEVVIVPRALYVTLVNNAVLAIRAATHVC